VHEIILRAYSAAHREHHRTRQQHAQFQQPQQQDGSGSSDDADAVVADGEQQGDIHHPLGHFAAKHLRAIVRAKLRIGKTSFSHICEVMGQEATNALLEKLGVSADDVTNKDVDLN